LRETPARLTLPPYDRKIHIGTPGKLGKNVHKLINERGQGKNV